MEASAAVHARFDEAVAHLARERTLALGMIESAASQTVNWREDRLVELDGIIEAVDGGDADAIAALQVRLLDGELKPRDLKGDSILKGIAAHAEAFFKTDETNVHLWNQAALLRCLRSDRRCASLQRTR